jgi:SPP1 gp7 family putative phage head morphogenesis protein
MQGEQWEPFFGGGGHHPGWALARKNWLRAKRAEGQFAVQLRQIARQIDVIVRGLWSGPGSDTSAIEQMLRRYADLIEPWARATSERLITEVSRRDAASWHELGKRISRSLRQEIETAPTGPALRELMDVQTGLIKNMPLEAEQRIHELAMSAVTGGRRWEQVAEEILGQGNVSRSRANLIARTEVGRAATTLMETRAVHVGSPGYIWRTALDRDVRPRHKKLEGSFHSWAEPPVAGEQGERAHPGAIYNCRCFPEVVIAEGDISRKQGVQPRNPEYLAALREQGYSTGTAFE